MDQGGHIALNVTQVSNMDSFRVLTDQESMADDCGTKRSPLGALAALLQTSDVILGSEATFPQGTLAEIETVFDFLLYGEAFLLKT